MLFARVRILNAFGESFPIACRGDALQDVHRFAIDAYQDAWFAILNSSEDAGGGIFGGGDGYSVKTLDAFFVEVGVRTSAGASVFGNGRLDSTRMNAGDEDISTFEFVAERFREAANRKFAGAIGALAYGADETKNARSVYDVGAFFFLEQGKEIGNAVEDAPEIDVHPPANIVEGEFFEISEQRDAGVVE